MNFSHVCLLLRSSGVKWAELTPIQAKLFQTNILCTILQIEKTFFDLADHDKGNVLIVCDRGAMDPSACEACMMGWEKERVRLVRMQVYKV